MITAFIETASARVSIAITRDGLLLDERSLPAPGGSQNRLLLPQFEQSLAASGVSLEELSLIATTAGPGSFTGVRSGLALVQGLALAKQIPCQSVSTLALVAASLPYAKQPVCVMLDARKQEVYTGRYRVGLIPEPLDAERAATPQSVIEQISEPTIFVGDGAQLYRDLLVDSLGSRALFAPSLMATPRAALGCLLAEARFTTEGSCPISQLTPCYLRLSEAEVARNARLAKTGTNF